MFSRRKVISQGFHGSRCASWQVSKRKEPWIACGSGVSREAHKLSNHWLDRNPEMWLECTDCRTCIVRMGSQLRGLRRSHKKRGWCRSGVSREAHDLSNHRFGCNLEMRLGSCGSRKRGDLTGNRLRGLRRSYKRCRSHVGWVRTSASRSGHAAAGRSGRLPASR